MNWTFQFYWALGVYILSIAVLTWQFKKELWSILLGKGVRREDANMTRFMVLCPIVNTAVALAALYDYFKLGAKE